MVYEGPMRVNELFIYNNPNRNFSSKWYFSWSSLFTLPFTL